MSSPLDAAAATRSVEWEGQLTLEHEGRPAVRLTAVHGQAEVHVENVAALKSLGAALACYRGNLDSRWLARMVAGLPERVALFLHGIPVGYYEPHEPLNWEAKVAGLPAGKLALDKLALLRASLKGD